MQEMYEGKSFSPKAMLANNIGAADTVIAVNDISEFLPGPNLATIGTYENAETIKYTVIAGNSLSGCERGKEGVAQAWAGGTAISRNFTNADYEAMRQNIKSSVQQGVGNASKIQFSDGETFQKKYDSGELTGPQGEAGRTPKKGVDYFDGASAYEIWLSEGNTGTEQDYLDSLKGERGITPTITVAETVTGEADSKAVVENIGTETAVQLKFTIPQGKTPVKGIDYFDGEKGGKGDTGAKGADAVLRIKATSDFTAAELPNGAWGGIY